MEDQRISDMRRSYSFRVAEKAMLVDFELEVGRLKAFILPEFESLTPDKHQEIEQLTLDNLRQTKSRLEISNDLFRYIKLGLESANESTRRCDF